MTKEKTETVPSEVTTTKLLSLTEAAAYVRLKTGTLYNYVCYNKIPYHKTGSGGVKFVKEELDEWLLGKFAK